MAKFKGKKMVAFVAAEDVTSNMYTDCLGPKKRIKYIVYLITERTSSQMMWKNLSR